MKKEGIYYLGRIIKRGELNTNDLIRAILKPVPITKRQISWTFIDTKEFKDEEDHYVYGRLSKYSPDAEVPIIIPERQEEIKLPQPNLRKASSPFVYIPAHSGIAFMQVPSQIDHWIFADRFCKLIEATYDSFFVECAIEMITDLRTFAMKLERLDGIYEIDATVSPPNPLYGPLWKELEDYLISRNTDRMRIDEEKKGHAPIKTELPRLIKEMAGLEEESDLITNETPKLGDAAILMAADGYGYGTVKGKKDEKPVVIKTSETVRNFSFDKLPDPKKLYLMVLKIFDAIKKDRHMEFK